jgi:hypothetical protein
MNIQLRPVGGSDPFTPETEIEMSGLMQTPRNGTGYFEVAAVAPQAPGSYLTAWELWVDDALMPGGVEQAISVLSEPVSLLDLTRYLQGRFWPGPAWLERADANDDGMVDVGDLVVLLNR